MGQKVDDFVIMDELIRIVQKNAEKECEINEETDLFEDVNIDSLGVVQILLDVEETFHIELDDVDLLSENFSNVGKFCALIAKQMAKKTI